MNTLLNITSRNLKIYFRDRTAVIFSLITMLIVIMLMVVFLGDMNVNAITELLSQFGGRDADADKTNAELTVLWWTISGIVSINAVTITLASISGMINDNANGRMQSFLASPVSRIQLAAGYMLSAWCSSVIICMATLIIAEIYAVTKGADFLSAAAHLKLLGMIAANSFAYSSIMYFLALLVKSEKAWSSMGTIIGTLVGFLGAIYVPMDALPEGIQSFLKCLPVLHGTAMFRSVITEDIVNKTFDGIPSEVLPEYREAMGITVKIGENMITPEIQLAILVGCGIIFMVLSAAVMSRSRKTDR